MMISMKPLRKRISAILATERFTDGKSFSECSILPDEGKPIKTKNPVTFSLICKRSLGNLKFNHIPINLINTPCKGFFNQFLFLKKRDWAIQKWTTPLFLQSSNSMGSKRWKMFRGLDQIGFKISQVSVKNHKLDWESKTWFHFV